MTENAAFPVKEWSVRETELHLDTLAQRESIFALSNGHIGLRGNLDEGEPHGFPGTYLNSFFELRPLPYAEGGYAYPESGQTVINVTNGKLIRLLVDDEPFDVRYGHVQSHERELDLRNGVLQRSVSWTSHRASDESVLYTHGVIHAAGHRGHLATRSSPLMLRYASLCSRIWLPTKHSLPRAMIPAWGLLLHPHLNARSIWLRVPSGS